MKQFNFMILHDLSDFSIRQFDDNYHQIWNFGKVFKSWQLESWSSCIKSFQELSSTWKRKQASVFESGLRKREREKSCVEKARVSPARARVELVVLKRE